MPATSMRRMIVPLSALVLIGAMALAFAILHFRSEPSAETKVTTTAPAVSSPASGAKDQAPAALAAAQKEATAVVAALGGSPLPPESADGVPSFDIARIEPTGDTVIAGRAAPGATVELLRNGEVHDHAVADQSGQFAMVPPRLPSGNYDLTLRSKQPDGKQITSKQNVAVALTPNRTEQPVVALMTPNKPTVVLSQPSASKSADGAVSVEAVEVEAGGKFHVSGRAHAGAAVRFYLNDSLVASATADPAGRFAITINEGVAPGNYRVRLDEVEASSGAVRARAEVPFNVPEAIVTASVPPRPAAPRPQDVAATTSPQPATSMASAQPVASSPSAVVVPKIATTTVSRGDSLWQISQTAYGAGMRYAVIYKANKEQIRNPNLIYPGQVFVLPTQ